MANAGNPLIFAGRCILSIPGALPSRRKNGMLAGIVRIRSEQPYGQLSIPALWCTDSDAGSFNGNVAVPAHAAGDAYRAVDRQPYPQRPYAVTEQRQPAQITRLRRPFFGDTHVHGVVGDASAQDTRNKPPQAYDFARAP